MTTSNTAPPPGPDRSSPTDPIVGLMIEIARPERIVAARRTLANLLAERYEAGATLQHLADLIGRSPGLVRTLLDEVGVSIRTRRSSNQPVEPLATTDPTIWSGPPEPMIRVQPENLDWSWQDIATYNAELVVELYVQGRSYDEVQEVTGYPADDVRAMALAARVTRPHQVERANTEWRAASRERLRRVHRMDLLYAWLDSADGGIEVDDIARAHNVPADMLWDLISAEFARVDSRRTLTVRPFGGGPIRPPCAGITCVFGCTRTCAVTVVPAESPDPAVNKQPGPGWPPRADLSDQIAINDDGTVSWKWFSRQTS